MFMIYINDLVHPMNVSGAQLKEKEDFIIFADDTNIFAVGSNELDVFKNAQIVLNNVYMNILCTVTNFI